MMRSQTVKARLDLIKRKLDSMLKELDTHKMSKTNEENNTDHSIYKDFVLLLDARIGEERLTLEKRLLNRVVISTRMKE